MSQSPEHRTSGSVAAFHFPIDLPTRAHGNHQHGRFRHPGLEKPDQLSRDGICRLGVWQNSKFLAQRVENAAKRIQIIWIESLRVCEVWPVKHQTSPNE